MKTSLRKLRQKARLTQVELAERTGIRQTSISALELGKVPDPRISTVRRLAHALDEPIHTVAAIFPDPEPGPW